MTEDQAAQGYTRIHIRDLRAGDRIGTTGWQVTRIELPSHGHGHRMYQLSFKDGVQGQKHYPDQTFLTRPEWCPRGGSEFEPTADERAALQESGG